MIRGRLFAARQRVAVCCPSKDGVISGQGVVITLIDAVEGDYGRVQFIYLVRLGDDLRVIPAEYMQPTENAK